MINRGYNRLIQFFSRYKGHRNEKCGLIYELRDRPKCCELYPKCPANIPVFYCPRKNDTKNPCCELEKGSNILFHCEGKIEGEDCLGNPLPLKKVK